MESSFLGRSFWYHWDVALVLASNLPSCMIREMTPRCLCSPFASEYTGEMRYRPPLKHHEIRGNTSDLHLPFSQQ